MKRRQDNTDIQTLLGSTFPGRDLKAALVHFTHAVNGFEQGDWEDTIVKTGKFVEAVLKAIGTHCKLPYETGRKFKTDNVINGLTALRPGTFDDSLRLLIPRSCRVIYDIASNRGARHDSEEIDPNSMDAHVVIPIAGWIVAELIRYSQKGRMAPAEAREAVESLVKKKYPLIEEIDGRIYLHVKKKSAVDMALVILARHHPKRVDRADLIDAVKRNGFSLANSKVAVGRIARLVDDDGSGRLRLLNPGLKRAESIITNALESD